MTWRRPTFARLVLAVSLTMAVMMTGRMVNPYATLPHPTGLAAILPLDALTQGPGWVALLGVHVAAAVAFLLRWREAVAGAVLLACLAVEVSLELSVRQIFMPHLETMLASDVLLAWLIGLGVGRLRGLEGAARDRFAHEVTAGVFGALLTISALSKLRLSGLGWVDGPTHCAVIYEHALMASGPLATFRFAVADTYALCSAGAVYALLTELLGVLFVLPALRKPHALAVVLLFAFLAVFQGIWEVSWALMAVGLAFSQLGGREDTAQPSTGAGP